MTSLIVLLAVVYGGLCALLYLFQGKLVYFPDPAVLLTPRIAGLDFREHRITTADGEQLHAWWLPSSVAQAPTLLFLHGNAGNISQRIDSLRIFHDLGLNSLIIDYRGYGLSTGKPSEQGTYLDAQAAYEFARRELGIPAQRLIIFGRSLGGGVATWLAGRNDCGGLILESSFISVPTLGQEIYPWMPVRWLSRIHYDNAARMPDIGCPILVIHSRDDQLIPFHHGRHLHDLAKAPKSFVELIGSHNDGFLVSGEIYLNGLRAFLKSLGKAAQSPQNQ